jgi:hypothetical protein
VDDQLRGHFAGTHEALSGREYTIANERNDLIGNLFIDRGGQGSVDGYLGEVGNAHVGVGEIVTIFEVIKVANIARLRIFFSFAPNLLSRNN